MLRPPLGTAGHQEVEGQVALPASLSGIVPRLLLCVIGDGFSRRESNHPTPSPSRGSRQCMMNSPGYSARGGGDGISLRVFTLTAGGCLLPVAPYLRGIATLGVGPAGEGGGTSPPPSLASLVERYSLTTPTARRVPRLLPPPQGGGQ